MSSAPGQVLVAEDNEANRDLIQRRLERRGYIAHSVCNGRDAVEFVHQTRPDIVLMDLEMPVMSGFDAIESLRSDRSFGQLPIIALTAHATAEIRRRCETVGFDDFVTKPIDFKALIEVLDRFGVRRGADGKVS